MYWSYSKEKSAILNDRSEDAGARLQELEVHMVYPVAEKAKVHS
jgi:hypothetical protein